MTTTIKSDGRAYLRPCPLSEVAWRVWAVEVAAEFLALPVGACPAATLDVPRIEGGETEDAWAAVRALASGDERTARLYCQGAPLLLSARRDGWRQGLCVRP